MEQVIKLSHVILLLQNYGSMYVQMSTQYETKGICKETRFFSLHSQSLGVFIIKMFWVIFSDNSNILAVVYLLNSGEFNFWRIFLNSTRRGANYSKVNVNSTEDTGDFQS